jgi:hypothetical protein
MEILVIATLMETTLIAALLAIFFLLRYTLKLKRRKSNTALAINYSDPVICRAIVLSIENTGTFLNDRVQMKIQVQVIPVKGRNFVTEIKELLTPEDLKNMRTGSTVSVKYNPMNRREISLIKAA